MRYRAETSRTAAECIYRIQSERRYNVLPRINYDAMPYERKLSTGEHVASNAFYNSDTACEESHDIFRGYYTYNYFGLEFFDEAPAAETVSEK